MTQLRLHNPLKNFSETRAIAKIKQEKTAYKLTNGDMQHACVSEIFSVEICMTSTFKMIKGQM